MSELAFNVVMVVVALITCAGIGMLPGLLLLWIQERDTRRIIAGLNREFIHNLSTREFPRWTPRMENHVPIASSNIKSVAYDPDTRTLEVTFANGGTYQYADVAPQHFEALQVHASPGSYFHQHVRSAHQATKVN